jgi:hypothetical protein
MPKRTNLFQQVVVIVHRHLAAEGAEVEESEELLDYETGEQREVDAAIRQTIAGYPIIVHVEATARGERADVQWVEKELGKHRAVRSNKLVLVSEAGFTESARIKAEHNGAIPLTAGDLGKDDPAGQIVNALGSVWPKTYSLTPRFVGVVVRLPDGQEQRVHVIPTIDVVAEDGASVGTIGEVLQQRMNRNWVAIAEQMGIADIEEDTDSPFEMTLTGWRGDLHRDDGTVEKSQACLRWEPDVSKEAEFHPIQRVDVAGEAHIAVTEVPLTHLKLGDVSVAFGTGKIDDAEALLVFTETDSGGKGTLRLTDDEGRDEMVTNNFLEPPPPADS